MSILPFLPSLPGLRATGRYARWRLALYLAGASALAACSSSDEAKAEPEGPPSIVLSAQDVAEARIADVSTGVLLTGTLEPAERAALTAQVAGTLGPFTADRGSRVRRGQRLTTIQAAGVRSQAAGARANVAAAEAQLAMARTQRDGQQRLYEAGAISRVQYENALASYAAAEAQVAAAKAQAAVANEAASYTVVTAPLAGVVSERPAEPGEAVASGDPILTIVNTATLELAGRIPVDEAGTVRVGQPVTFTLDAFPGRAFNGSVVRKDPAADPSTRQVGIYVRLPNSSGEITAGQFARGQVRGDRVVGAVTIPVTAVVGSGTNASVFVIENNALARRAISLGPRDDASGVVAVTSGLKAGERVLARPTTAVVEGQPVIIGSDQLVGDSMAAASADKQPSAGPNNRAKEK
jgi:membrane fusion protein (multidrug efflux system)